jgi:hypothetical protein
MPVRKKFLAFAKYKRAVRALGITSVKELKSRLDEIPGAPFNPNVIYKNKGWKGHADLFGKNGIRGGRANRSTQHHGESRNGKITPEFRAWSGMMSRCFLEKSSSFRYYGAKGITVCKRWRVFNNFLSDLARKPTKQHSLGRFGDVGNYEPGNCAWQTRKEQLAEKCKKYATRHYISKYRPTPQVRIAEPLPIAA